MYTNGIGQLQRHWTPAFAGVTLFGLVTLKILGLSIFNLLGMVFKTRNFAACAFASL